MVVIYRALYLCAVQVGRYMEEADVNGDGQLDIEEFQALVRKMWIGSPHEGPLAPKVIHRQESIDWTGANSSGLMLSGVKTSK